MQDAGIAFMEASNSEVYDNTFTNVKYGIRLSLGSEDNNIHDNEFDTMSECTCPSYPPSRFLLYETQRSTTASL